MALINFFFFFHFLKTLKEEKEKHACGRLDSIFMAFEDAMKDICYSLIGRKRPMMAATNT